MNLRDKFEGQMSCSMSCFFRSPLLWIALLVPILIHAGFLGCGFFPLLFTTLLFILSSFSFSSSKHKPVPVESSVKDEALTSGHQVEEAVAEALQLLSETTKTVTQQKETAQEGEMGQADQTNSSMVGSILDSFSESESVDQSSTTDQDSEIEWPYAGNLGHSPDCSDDSISDEESLIEIALPSGHYVDPKKEEPKPNSNQRFPDYFLKPHSLMELLAEVNDMNEEDNLIEIDISMGSIKCSRFEIEA